MQFPRPVSPSLRRPSSDAGTSGGNTRSTSGGTNGNGGPHRVRFPDNLGNDSTHWSLAFLQFAMDCFTACVALVCIAGVSTLLAVLHVIVRPFSITVYRRLAAQFVASSFLNAMALLLPNTRIHLTGDSDLPTPVGTSMMVSNHLADGDWWAIFMLGRCVGLQGTIKVFLRNEYLNVSIPNEESGWSNGSASSSSLTTATGPTSFASKASNVKPPPSVHSHTNGGSTAASASPGSIPSASTSAHHAYPQDLSILAKLLHLFLEFPLINGEDYSSNREQLFHLLRSFAEHDGTTAAPIHLLFFPEGWSQHNGADRQSTLKISNEFAQREGRPQLKHLLLPRARGFNSSLECLRESNPVVYDITMANVGYDGSLPPSVKLSAPTLWNILRRKFPREVHMRIKRYSMEDVLQDRSWLDKRWAEKDRLLSYFARHQSFPVEGRGYSRERVLDSRYYSLETSVMSLIRLLLVPFAVPLLLLLSVPLFWTFAWIWLVHRVYRLIFPDHDLRSSGNDIIVVEESSQTPGSSSAGTPFCPTTPFASPSLTSWRDLFSNQRDTGE